MAGKKGSGSGGFRPPPNPLGGQGGNPFSQGGLSNAPGQGATLQNSPVQMLQNLGLIGPSLGNTLSSIAAFAAAPGIGTGIPAVTALSNTAAGAVQWGGRTAGAAAGLNTGGVMEGFNQAIEHLPIFGKLLAETNRAFTAFLRGLDQAAAHLAPYSGEISAAQGRVQAASIQGDIGRANLLGKELGQYAEARGRLENAGQDVLARLIKPIIPIVTRGVEMLAKVFEVITKIQDFFSGLADGIANMVGKVGEVLSKVIPYLDTIIECYKKILEWFLGEDSKPEPPWTNSCGCRSPTIFSNLSAVSTSRRAASPSTWSQSDMPPAITPANAMCSYGTGDNMVSFDSLMRTEVEMAPVEDAARRTITAWDHTLSVWAWVTDSNATDATMETYRNILTRPGDVFNFSSKGFGRLQVNDHQNGDRRDNSGGPWPLAFSWKPIGNNLGAAVHWKVKATLPANVSYHYQQGILSCNYAVDYDVDDLGYTLISTHGTITVPMTRNSVNSPALPDDADRLLEKVVPPLAPGFDRIQKKRSISEDKRSLTFTFVDRQLAHVPPAGIPSWEVRHRIGSSDKEGFENWTGSYHVTMATPAGTPPALALSKFLTFVGNRLGLAKQRAFDLLTAARGKPGTVMLKSLEVEELVSNFDNRSSFHLGYSILGCGLQYFIPVSAIYTDTDEDWTRWQQSLAGSALHPRGNARIKRDANDDRIIDLRISGGQTPVVHTGSQREQAGQAQPVQFAENALAALGIQPKYTWIKFENSIDWIEQQGVAEHVPLSDKVVVLKKTDATSDAELAPNNDAAEADANARNPNLIQMVGLPVRRLRMRGAAVRLGYPIEAPEILTVGGTVPTLSETGFRQKQIGKVGGVPINFAQWDRIYLVPRSPRNTLPQAANPMLKLDGD